MYFSSSGHVASTKKLKRKGSNRFPLIFVVVWRVREEGGEWGGGDPIRVNGVGLKWNPRELK